MLVFQLAIGFRITETDQYRLCVVFLQRGLELHQFRCRHVAIAAFRAPVDEQDSASLEIGQGDRFAGQLRKFEIVDGGSNSKAAGPLAGCGGFRAVQAIQSHQDTALLRSQLVKEKAQSEKSEDLYDQAGDDNTFGHAAWVFDVRAGGTQALVMATATDRCKRVMERIN